MQDMARARREAYVRRKGYKSVRETVVLWGAFFVVLMTARLWAHFADYGAAAAITLTASSMTAWCIASASWVRWGRQRFTSPDNSDGPVQALD